MEAELQQCTFYCMWVVLQRHLLSCYVDPKGIEDFCLLCANSSPCQLNWHLNCYHHKGGGGGDSVAWPRLVGPPGHKMGGGGGGGATCL